ncbi:MAG: murein biosynthesis integral membrane protein MurJ [Thermotogota bacterium]|nr:murein biosynthesis integral membrane protein MurJ [Thermotogota bacterium]
MSHAILKGTIAFAIATLISRSTGLIRDMFFAKYFGTSVAYDAYLVAILIPFFLRKIFGEGALSLIFVPMFKERYQISKTNAFKFASTIIILVIAITGTISLSGVIFSKPISLVFAGGFDSDTIALTSSLMKITFPFVLLVSLWSIYYGVLNSMGTFFIAALSPAFINLATIIGILLSKHLQQPIIGPTIGFLLGGIVQLFLLMIFSHKKEFKFYPSFDRSDARQFISLFLLTVIAPAINQLNSMVDVRVATELKAGAVASLQYAMRLYQLPLGIFAIAVATVSLPEFTSKLKNNDLNSIKPNILESLRTLTFFILPSLFALLFMSKDIMALLFQRGAFSAQDTLITSSVLRAYLLGLPFYGYFGILARVYYAMKKPIFPAIVASVMAATNIVLDIVLGFAIGVSGIALATSISGIIGLVIVSPVFIKSIGFHRYSLLETLKILLATAIMTAGILFVQTFFDSSTMRSLFLLIVALLLYLLSTKILKIDELKHVTNLLKRKK